MQTNSKYYHFEYSPASDSVVDESIKSVRWESIKIHLAIWFEAIRKEVESPNLWSELKKKKKFPMLLLFLINIIHNL